MRRSQFPKETILQIVIDRPPATRDGYRFLRLLVFKQTILQTLPSEPQ
jgi:hypothetical protein